MKKIFALLALFAFIGVVSTPASASVIDFTDNTTVQLSIDDDNAVVADIEKDKKKKKDKKKAKLKKAAAKSSECGSVKSGCGEASSEGCGSSCTETKKEGSKEVKK